MEAILRLAIFLYQKSEIHVYHVYQVLSNIANNLQDRFGAHSIIEGTAKTLRDKLLLWFLEDNELKRSAILCSTPDLKEIAAVNEISSALSRDEIASNLLI